MVTDQDEGCINVERIFNNVDFPDPDGPMIATNSPLSTVNDRLCSTSCVTPDVLAYVLLDRKSVV